jgi:hypothetical protein
MTMDAGAASAAFSYFVFMVAPISVGPTRDLVLLVRGVMGVATPSARISGIEYVRVGA